MVDFQSVLSYVVIIILGVPFLVLVTGKIISMILSYGATKTVTLKPDGAPKGKSMVVYEPGATGLTKTVAEKIGNELQSQGFEVKVAGIRSEEAKNTSGYKILVFGSPTYIGRPTGEFKNHVKNLRPNNGQIIGLYITGAKGAPAVGLVPKVFLDSMKKPLAESGIKAREMAFIGPKEFDYAEFVSRLADPNQTVI